MILGEFPNLVVSNLVVCNFYVETLFCALAFALFFFYLRSLARIYVFLRPTTFGTTAFGNCGSFWPRW